MPRISGWINTGIQRLSEDFAQCARALTAQRFSVAENLTSFSSRKKSGVITAFIWQHQVITSPQLKALHC